MGISVLYSAFILSICSFIYGQVKGVQAKVQEIETAIADVYKHLQEVGDFSNVCAEAVRNINSAIETLDKRTKCLDYIDDRIDNLTKDVENG